MNAVTVMPTTTPVGPAAAPSTTGGGTTGFAHVLHAAMSGGSTATEHAAAPTAEDGAPVAIVDVDLAEEGGELPVTDQPDDGLPAADVDALTNAVVALLTGAGAATDEAAGPTADVPAGEVAFEAEGTRQSPATPEEGMGQLASPSDAAGTATAAFAPTPAPGVVADGAAPGQQTTSSPADGHPVSAGSTPSGLPGAGIATSSRASAPQGTADATTTATPAGAPGGSEAIARTTAGAEAVATIPEQAAGPAPSTAQAPPADPAIAPHQVATARADAIVAPDAPTPGGTPTAPAPQAPATQVASAIAALRRNGEGSYTASIDLHPAELGQVRIEVEVRAGVVSVLMTPEQASTRTLLAQQMHQLRESLQQAGLDAGSLDVASQSQQDAASREDTSDAHQRPDGDDVHESVLASPVAAARDHQTDTSVDRRV